jgi:hypothetical protein
MAHVLWHFKVEDYARWKSVFDEDPATPRTPMKSCYFWSGMTTSWSSFERLPNPLR